MQWLAKPGLIQDNFWSVLCLRLDFSKIKWNKKVLLRERKRHTARRVASARYAAPSGGGTPSHSGGYPSHVLMVEGGYPGQVLMWGGYPPPSRPSQGGTLGPPHCRVSSIPIFPIFSYFSA